MPEWGEENLVMKVDTNIPTVVFKIAGVIIFVTSAGQLYLHLPDPVTAGLIGLLVAKLFWNVRIHTK
jgi:hypothetical protein